MLKQHVRVNHQINAPELRVIGPAGENYGVMSLKDALLKADGLGLDLIEISPSATPPVAKLMDFGKFQYETNKKIRAARAHLQPAETKTIQVTIGTSEHDLALKARKAAEWLNEGHRIKVNLFLKGREKYLDTAFLNERLARVLKLIPVEYKFGSQPTKGPRGMTLTIEKK